MKRKLFFYCFTMFLFVCAAAYGNDEKEVRRSFSVDPGASITLENISGNITITSWEGAKVEMIAVKNGKSDLFDQVEILTSARASRLNIRTKYLNNGNNINVSVQYDLKVPRNVVLDRIESVSGNIKISGVDGRITARTVSGRVHAVDITGRSTINSVSGNVIAGNIKGDIVAASVSGNVQISQIQGCVQASSVSGSVFIENNSPSDNDLIASAVSGSIRFDGRLDPDGQYDIKSHSGTVTLNLPVNSNFVIDASTSTGSIKSDFDIRENEKAQKTGKAKVLAGVVGSGGPIVDLRTYSGNILIRKTTDR